MLTEKEILNSSEVLVLGNTPMQVQETADQFIVQFPKDLCVSPQDLAAMMELLDSVPRHSLFRSLAEVFTVYMGQCPAAEQNTQRWLMLYRLQQWSEKYVETEA